MGLLEERRQRGSTLARVSVIAELTCAAAAGVHMSYQKQKPLIQVSMKNFFVFVKSSFEHFCLKQAQAYLFWTF